MKPYNCALSAAKLMNLYCFVEPSTGMSITFHVFHFQYSVITIHFNMLY